jgi:hypothetical protein
MAEYLKMGDKPRGAMLQLDQNCRRIERESGVRPETPTRYAPRRHPVGTKARVASRFLAVQFSLALVRKPGGIQALAIAFIACMIV